MAKLNTRHVTIKDLQQAGIPIHTSKEYFKEWPKPKQSVSLERVRAILSKLPGSLADEVSRMRDEEG
ncbi:MAG: hypothetical protein Q8R91_06280 [Candidatus Omnitrophota bacterium]|nr:hypothetical protein [Candidatus Omnitrophota bacterium]